MHSVRSSVFSGEPTHIVALDCEYVGGGTDGSDDLLARVSIVNEVWLVIKNRACIFSKCDASSHEVSSYILGCSTINVVFSYFSK